MKMCIRDSHGAFDLSYLSSIPNMTVLAPADGTQLEEMLDYAINEMNSPVAIRLSLIHI